MGGFYVHGRQRDFLLTDDLASIYGPPAKAETTDASDFYNRPEPPRLNRKQRRTEAAKVRKMFK